MAIVLDLYQISENQLSPTSARAGRKVHHLHNWGLFFSLPNSKQACVSQASRRTPTHHLHWLPLIHSFVQVYMALTGLLVDRMLGFHPRLFAEAENPEASPPESITHTVPSEVLPPPWGAPRGLAQVPAAYTTPPDVPHLVGESVFPLLPLLHPFFHLLTFSPPPQRGPMHYSQWATNPSDETIYHIHWRYVLSSLATRYRRQELCHIYLYNFSSWVSARHMWELETF